MKPLLMRCVCVAFLVSVSNGAGAGDLLIKNVRLHGSDEVFNIYADDGVIRQVGAAAPAATEVIEGNGGFVTPGLIDSGSTLGIEEVGLSTRAEDHQYDGDQMGAAFNPALAFNAASSIVPSLLDEGVSHVFLKPVPGRDVFAGQGTLADLAGNIDSSRPDAVLVYLGEGGREIMGKSRAAALQRLTLGLTEASLFDENRRAYQANRLRDLEFPYLDLEALARVIRGEAKLVVYVDRASEISSVLDQLDSFDIDLVLMGAREAWKVADEIRDRNVPVILNVLDNRPASFDRLGARLDQPRLLHEAGVLFAFMTEDLYTETRVLAQAAGVAVAYGLPWQAALDAITVNPARIWGAADRLGTLAVGMEATLVIWDGDPLEITSYANEVVIRGERMSRQNRQDMLRDRYFRLEPESGSFSYSP